MIAQPTLATGDLNECLLFLLRQDSQFVWRLAVDVLGRETHHPTELVIHIDVFVVERRCQRDRVTAIFEDGLELLFVLPKLLFGAPLVGDFAKDAGESDERSATIAQPRDREQSVELLSIFSAQPGGDPAIFLAFLNELRRSGNVLRAICRY